MATVGENLLNPTDLDPITLRSLDAFRRRRGLLLLLRALGVGTLVFVSLALTLATLDYLLFFPDSFRWSLSIAIYVATAAAMWFTGIAPLRVRDEIEIAKHVESVSPNLREDLVSAVELSDPNSANGSVYFRRLLQNRVAKRIAKIDIGKVLPLRLVRRWVLSGGTVAAFCIAMMFIPSAQFGRRLARAALPGFAIERASQTKVTIVHPSPASGFVAERDAVGVIVRVQGADPDDVMLHWRSDDGTSGESMMTPRLDAADFQPRRSSNPLPKGDQMGGRFAANLSVGSHAVQYQITAGDAITLWHTLTPLPRPRVVRFEKLYRLPSYAKLSDRTADEEHGDLKALQGTKAELTVTFDQPVENPVLRFGVRGARIEMEPVDDLATKFMSQISIKTSGQYQVDATSVQSGLNNPFSPNNMITPVLDTSPAVRWAEGTKPTRLVSSLDVIEMAASASDDLPLDRVLQQVQLNDEKFQSYALSIDAPSRKLDLNWSWDLMRRIGESSTPEKLAAGDLVKTRLVAIDRKGTRTESRLIEFLIVGDGFDADRHQFLEPLAKRINKVTQWADQTKAVADGVSEVGKSGQYGQLPALREKWKTLQSESVGLIKSTSQTLSQTQNSASASMTELVGRSILDVESRLDSQIKRLVWLADHDAARWEKHRKRFREETGRDAHQTAYQCQRLSEFARARFELALAAAMYSDVRALESTVIRLIQQTPKQRLPRYLTLISGQIAEIDRLFLQYETMLTAQTKRHLSEEYWLRWSQRWSIQIETLLEDNASLDQVLAVLRSLRDQVKDKPQHVIHSGIHNTATRWGRDLRKEMLYLSDLTRRLSNASNEWERAKTDAQNDRNAEDAIEGGLTVDWQETKWRTGLKRLVVRTAGQEQLNRSKSKVDLTYAADQSLFLRAIKNVTFNGSGIYKEERVYQVLNNIAGAISILQASHDLSAARDDLLAIREGERQHDAAPLRKIYHPVWFKLQSTRIELGVQYLGKSKVDWRQYLDRINATRANNDYKQALSRIDSRQWKMDSFVSAEKQLESMASDLQTGLDDLSEFQQQAREVLRQYVLKLSQQARQAAEAAKQAKQSTDARDDASEESAEQVEPEQQRAVDQATDTIGALIDQANTLDIVDDQQREVARDADAAAELIAEAVKETREAMKNVQASESTGKRDDAMEAVENRFEALASRLEETADHFEKIENGEDVTESRERLRQAEEQLKAAGELQERYDRAEEMAETAKQDPRELLEQLEQELKRNEPMQDALSDIAGEMVHNAAKTLELASKDEDTLQRRLESGDAAFTEQKRQQQMMLDEFVRRAVTLRDRTLATASSAAGWANDPKARDSVNQIREQVSEAIKQAEQALRDNTTLAQIDSATRKMQQDLSRVAAATKQIADQMSESVSKDLHQDDKKRAVTAEAMKKAANQLRNEELKAVDQQRKKLVSTENAAGRRIRTAEQQARKAESVIKREQAKLEKNPDDEPAKGGIQSHQERRDESARVAKESRRTKELARERQQQANARANAINDKKQSPLDQPNPAAQLGKNLARDATMRLEQLSKELQAFNGESKIAQDLRADSNDAKNLSREQESVKGDVQSAVDDLARASRHEGRLERPELAQQLAQASEQTEQNAGQPAADAGREIEKSIGKSDNAAAASQSLQEAADKIASQAEAVGKLLQQGQSQSGNPDGEASDPSDANSQSQAGEPSDTASADAMQSPNESSGQQPSGQQTGASQQSPSMQSGTPSEQSSGDSSDAKQMAQTLDELDRSLAAQAQSQGQPGDGKSQSGENSQSDQGQPSQQTPGDDQAGQSGQPSDDGRQNAIDVSPTLAQMLEAQMQQAARDRMKSLQQAQAGEKPGDQSSSDKSSPNPFSESGEGDPADGPENLDLLRGRIADGQWGDLRRRGTDDAAQGRGSRIPPGYAREINAYFKAISKRAAENK